jgi:hypothetical protein
MKPSEETTPPDPGDLEGWRQAASNHRLAAFRPEAIVSALQDLGPNADTNVRNALAKQLNTILMNMLRRYIGTNHPNKGEDIILRVHGEIFEAILEKDSADGRALSEAFGPRVEFRAKDAIAAEYRHSRIPLAPKVREPERSEDEHDIATDKTKAAEISHLVRGSDPSESSGDVSGFVGDDAVSAAPMPDSALLETIRHIDGRIDAERALARIEDYRKRLAFRLFMEDIPYGSKRTYSIAEAVGVSAKTAEKWIAEVQRLLAATDEVQELKGTKVGERS